MNATHQATGEHQQPSVQPRRDDNASYIFPTFSESSGAAIDGPTPWWLATPSNGGDLEAYRYDGACSSSGRSGAPAAMARDLNDAGDIVGSADTAGGQLPRIPLSRRGDDRPPHTRRNDLRSPPGSTRRHSHRRLFAEPRDVPRFRLRRDDDNRPRVARWRDHRTMGAEQIRTSSSGRVAAWQQGAFRYVSGGR